MTRRGMSPVICGECSNKGLTCDGKSPICRNCTESRSHCFYNEVGIVVSQNKSDLLNAACDECRNRKLKCSGELPMCRRCEEDNAICIYSPRKRMGRPRKRQRSDQEPTGARAIPKSPGVIGSYYPTSETILINSHNNATAIEPWLVQGAADLGIQQYMADSHIHSPPMSAITYPQTSPYLQRQQASAYPTPPGGTDAGSPTILSQKTCNCMTIMTNIMDQMRTFQTFQFPVSIGLLRNALSTVKTVIHCTICADAGISALQNTTMLQATLFSLVDRFNVMIKSMDQEADRLAHNGEMKSLKVADPTDLMIMHTGTADCPAGLVVQVSSEQWREMSRRALRKLLFGPDDSLTKLLDVWETRQTKWHSDLTMLLKRQEMFPEADVHEENGAQPGGCLSVISRIRTTMQRLKI